ncbi:11307_t:CDS:2, partial [Scutellospora calospora]
MSIGDLDEDRFFSVGTGFVSSFTARYCKEIHLFVLKIEEYQYVLEIYLDSKCINTITGTDSDEIWDQIELFKKHT